MNNTQYLSQRKNRTKEEIIQQCQAKGMVGQYFGASTNTEFKCLHCGKIYKAQPCNILNGNTKSCGCRTFILVKEALYKGGKYISSTEFSGIKNKAKERNLEFSITIEDIDNLYEKQNKKCSLTGLDISFNSGQNNYIKIRGNASIDRIDNNKGYTVENIQILDKDINFMKRDFTQDKFITLCKMVVNNEKKNLS
jgi:predicted  nucleic acid-binding Zn-ribbon protein